MSECHISRRRALGLATAALVAPTTRAHAQEYPGKPLTLVIPFSAGGSSDTLGRSVARSLGAQMKQTVLADNRAGAGGLLGAQYVANAPADGYTLLFGTIGTHAIAAVLKKTLPYDVDKSFAAVGRLQDGPMVLVVNASMPVNSVRDLIEYSKKNPGSLSYGSAGVGSISHLAGEMLRAETGVDIVHIPYKGGGSALPDLLGGQIQLMVETIPNVISSVDAGRLKALAVSSDKRVPTMMAVPTFAEQGFPKISINAWTGLFVPANTPSAIIDRLNAEIRTMDVQPDYIDRTLKAGNVVAAATTPAEFAAFVRAEVVRWRAVARASQIEPE